MTDVDVKSISKAVVYKNGIRVGALSRTTHGAVFFYDDAYFENPKTASLSHILSKNHKRHEVTGTNLHPFFAGLLPEGLRLNALIKSVKTSADDLFSLLLVSGADCVGDVAVLPEDVGLTDQTPTLDLSKATEISFFEFFKKSLVYQNRFEKNIPGVQNKISAGLISFPVQSKRKSKTYILKLTPKGYKHLVENEFFFMNLAKHCGFSVPDFKMVIDREGEKGFLIERFDRVFDTQAKKVQRTYQEDACQLLNLYPADKYRVSHRDIAEVLEECCSAAIPNLVEYLRLIVFSYLIWNGDLHAKNVSVIQNLKTQHIELSPVYDLVSTLPYHDSTLALHVEGKKDNLRSKDFIHFAKGFGINENVVARVLTELCTRVGTTLTQLDQIGFPEKETKQLQRSIEKRIKDLSGNKT